MSDFFDMARFSRPHGLPLDRCRRQRRLAPLPAMAMSIAVIWTALVSLAPLPVSADGPAEQARLPELVLTKHRTFSIPFRLPKAQDAESAPQRVSMSVSQDLGGSWEAAPEQTKVENLPALKPIAEPASELKPAPETSVMDTWVDSVASVFDAEPAVQNKAPEAAPAVIKNNEALPPAELPVVK
jgi:hypothetical protein